MRDSLPKHGRISNPDSPGKWLLKLRWWYGGPCIQTWYYGGLCVRVFGGGDYDGS